MTLGCKFGPSMSHFVQSSPTTSAPRERESLCVAPRPAPYRDCNAVYIVDGRVQDYFSVPSGIPSAAVRLRYFDSAGQALRAAVREPPSLYLVNAQLPDMSGFDLYAMLADRWPQVAGYLISDSHDPQIEVRARCAGSTLYFCKPLAMGWLAAMLKTMPQLTGDLST